MRVLNTQTLKFENISDSELHHNKKEYAILSHRWGSDEDEISFRDIQHSTNWAKKKGSVKVIGFCKLAASMGCQYGWIDTCCINKETSSELSEAINSMYYWYQCSKTCIAYLEDVPQRKFEESSWFDRGWTLQELIAPKVVIFFDKNWKSIGAKSELTGTLGHKTGIPSEVLEHRTTPFACSVAERMSWAADRITTRIEDRAYSLMGLFDVNMPMIYGERDKAFLRLQQHIIQKTKDESIFAWDMEAPGESRSYSGMFAQSPSAFAKCSNVVQWPGSHGFSEMNGELSIRLKLVPAGMESYYAMLHCTDATALPFLGNCCILIGITSSEGIYVRIKDPRQASRKAIEEYSTASLGERELHIPLMAYEPPLRRFPGFWLRTLQPPGHNDRQAIIWSNTRCSQADRICQEDFTQDITGIVHLKPSSSPQDSDWYKVQWITFGFDANFNPVLWFANNRRFDEMQEKFGEFITSGVGSRSEDWDCELIRKPCINDGSMEWPSDKDSHHELFVKAKWPTGAHVVRVKRDSGCKWTVLGLNVKISVELQSDPDSIADDIDGSSTTTPKDVWVVDITDSGGENPHERWIREERGPGKKSYLEQALKPRYLIPGVDLMMVLALLNISILYFLPWVTAILREKLSTIKQTGWFGDASDSHACNT